MVVVRTQCRESPQPGWMRGWNEVARQSGEAFAHQRMHDLLPELAARPSAEDRQTERNRPRATARRR